MGGDEREFFKAIIAAPDDDTPRLVFADWLQDRGQDERAEFIRVQIELHHMAADAPENCVPRWAELSARERELWELHGRNNADWFPIYSLPGFVTVEPVGCEGLSGGNGDIAATPVRGFVERVDLSAGYWIEYGDAIVAANPVTKVVLTTSPRGDDWWDNGAIQFVDGPPGIRHGRWPGITFELPPEFLAGTVVSAMTFDRLLSDAEMDTVGAYLQNRHGIPAPQQP